MTADLSYPVIVGEVMSRYLPDARLESLGSFLLPGLQRRISFLCRLGRPLRKRHLSWLRRASVIKMSRLSGQDGLTFGLVV